MTERRKKTFFGEAIPFVGFLATWLAPAAAAQIITNKAGEFVTDSETNYVSDSFSWSENWDEVLADVAPWLIAIYVATKMYNTAAKVGNSLDR